MRRSGESVARQARRRETAAGRTLRRVRALNEIALRVQGELEEAAIVRLLPEELARLGMGSAVLLADAAGREATVAAVGFSDPQIQTTVEGLLGRPAVGLGGPIDALPFLREAAAQGDSRFARDLPASITGRRAEIVAEIIRATGTRGTVVAPLVARGRGLGFLIVMGQDLREEDVPFVTAFAGYAALAIENARLIAEERRAARLQTVAELGATVAHELLQPLTILTGYLELLRFKAPAADEAERYYAEMARAADQLAEKIDLIQRLRDYTTKSYGEDLTVIDLDGSLRREPRPRSTLED